MALFLGQSLLETGQLTASRVEQLYQTKAFDTWKKAQEGEVKLTLASLERLDNIIRGLVNLARR